jgi:hypothetical protein
MENINQNTQLFPWDIQKIRQSKPSLARAARV